ncbi:13089_t:CDS:2 [Acaulospora morrowiae]|uniref:13089_t:CDS:1 n=1 Tax=Acaulospora morrowiae TaxID=94023 RepID=A0A9N9B472_9GLOM|nr:13089_t:CDS:2 [Acaulospora morrowiae]
MPSPLKLLSLSFLRSIHKQQMTEMDNHVKSLGDELRRSRRELDELKQNVTKVQENYRQLLDEKAKLQKEILELVKKKSQELEKDQWEKENRELIKEEEQWKKGKQRLIEDIEQWEKGKQRLIEDKEQWEKEKRKLIEEKEQWEKEKRRLIEEKEQWEKEERKLIEEKEQWEKEERKLIEEKEQWEKERQMLIEEKEQWEKGKQEWTKEKEQWKKEKQDLIKGKEQWEQWEQWENEKQSMEKHIETLEQHEKTQKETFMQKFQELKEVYSKKIDALIQRLDEKGSDLRELEEKTDEFQRKVIRYQSSLDVPTNVRLGDNDWNHPVQLKRDIENLQNILENYVTHLKPNMNIDVKKVRMLAKEYDCINEITEENLNKPFIKTILQRKALDLVLSYQPELLNQQGKDYALETDIEMKMKELLDLINALSKTRKRNDKVVDTTVIKIRQQVYGVLGNYGFNDIIRDNKPYLHDLIHRISKKLNAIMSEYRKINDVNMKTRVESMAPKLVRDICKLFWFRVNVQEPTIEIFFFPKDTIIDQNMMEGKWNDDETNQSSVDVCYFPMFISGMQSSDRKIHAPARVFPQKNLI